MKRTFTIMAVVLFTTTLWAQSPEKISYQAIVRDASNNLVTNTLVGMRIQIIQTSEFGTAVYVETQTPTTNANGLISLEIGGGTIVSGTFSTIDWGNDNYYIKTETDPAGGTNYSITGTSQLLSVPYALFAQTAGNNLQGDTSVTNEIQTLSITDDQLSISDGNTVTLPSATQGESDSLVLRSPSGARWCIKVANDGSISSTQIAQNGFILFQALLGGSSSSIGGQMASSTGEVFTITNAPANSGIIDLVYEYDSIAIIAPDATLYGWPTLHTTRFKTTTLSSTDFYNIIDESDINIAAAGASLKGVANLSVNDVIAFYSPVNSKNALILITEINLGASGGINFDIKFAE